MKVIVVVGASGDYQDSSELHDVEIDMSSSCSIIGRLEGSSSKSDSGQKFGVIERYTERALRRVTVAALIISQTWFWTSQTNTTEGGIGEKIFFPNFLY